jgi:hypothetical protein
VERRFELESLRRSLAMLGPGAPALGREDAIELIAELQDVEARLRRLKSGLQALIRAADADTSGSQAGDGAAGG